MLIAGKEEFLSMTYVSVAFAVFFLVLAVASYNMKKRMLSKDMAEKLKQAPGFDVLYLMAVWNFRFELIGFLASSLLSLLDLLKV
jgi:hypothetical protein